MLVLIQLIKLTPRLHACKIQLNSCHAKNLFNVLVA